MFKTLIGHLPKYSKGEVINIMCVLFIYVHTMYLIIQTNYLIQDSYMFEYFQVVFILFILNFLFTFFIKISPTIDGRAVQVFRCVQSHFIMQLILSRSHLRGESMP